jgi:hypothetical protein
LALELELLDLLEAREVRKPAQRLAALRTAAPGFPDESDRKPPAPGRLEFELPNAVGTAVRSTDLLAEGPIVLLVFRGFWSALDVERLVLLETMASAVASEGGRCVALSPVIPAGCLSGAGKARISYEMLSDVGAIVGQRLTGSAIVRAQALWGLRRLGVDVVRTYGLQRPRFALPGIAVIGRDATVMFRAVFGPTGPIDHAAFAMAFESLARA